MTLIFSLLLVYFLLVGSSPSDAASWTYGNGPYGPSSWATLFPYECAGTSQSPINIQTSDTVFSPSLPPFIHQDLQSTESKFIVKNNGHTVQVDVQGDYYVSGGGLGAQYKVAQFHFHWGSDEEKGSEHTINGDAAPIEMHIVTWNSDVYGSIGEAVAQPEGLAVLGIMFYESDDNNPVFDSLIQALPEVRDPDAGVSVSIPAVSLESFLPSSPENYFRYAGSLTTPACYESVVWTVFEKKQFISEDQLEMFSMMMVSGGATGCSDDDDECEEGGRALVDNYRPVQDLNGRTVYRSF